MNSSFPGQAGLASSVEKLRGDLDKWLDVAWTQGERAIDAIGLRSGRAPLVDVIERPDSILVLVDLPGVSVEQVELTVVGLTLTIKGQYAALDLGGGRVMSGERPKGEFQRSLTLPATVNADDIRAESRNGVLQIVVAKTEPEKSKRVPIQAVT